MSCVLNGICIAEEAERLEHEGAGDVEHTGEPSPLDMIVLSGRDTKCEEAKQALLALVPITKKARVVLVCRIYH